MEPEKHRIFIKSLELFKQFGVKAVTMDQISSACGISKKTLYKYVENKNDLIDQCFDMAASHMKGVMLEELAHSQGNAIDKLFALETFAEKNLRGEEDRLMNQLQMYYPEVSAKVNAQRETLVMGFTLKNLEEGMAQGLYRADLNVKAIAILYYGHVLAVHENVVGDNDVDFDELRKVSLRYHIRGIASAKGLEYLNQRITQQ